MYIKLHWYSKVKILGGSFKKIIKGKTYCQKYLGSIRIPPILLCNNPLLIVIMLKLRYRQKINVIK